MPEDRQVAIACVIIKPTHVINNNIVITIYIDITAHIDAIHFVTLFSSSSIIRTEGVCQTIDYIYLQATTARRSAFLWFHKCLDHSPRDAPPAFSQRLTNTIPFFLSFAVIVILGIEVVHALSKVPPEVLNGVKVWGIWWPENCHPGNQTCQQASQASLGRQLGLGLIERP
jgi:hypothetical protein